MCGAPGCVRLEKTTQLGDGTVVISRLGPPAVFGEFFFLMGGARTASLLYKLRLPGWARGLDAPRLLIHHAGDRFQVDRRSARRTCALRACRAVLLVV